MKKYADRKSKTSSKAKYRKENTLDYYISKIPAGVNNSNWWNEDEDNDFSDAEHSKKYQFLKKDIKASSIVPANVEFRRDIPNNMGFFETKFGTISVGYKKYKKYTPIAFSIVPESVKERSGIPEKKIDGPNTYFGGPTYGKGKKFKASQLTFKFDPGDRENIKKLEDDNDGIKDEEEKLLYQDENEDETIESLREVRNENGRKRLDIDKEIKKMKDIKEEKNEDNLDFLKEIDNFVKKLERNKLKKYVDADDAVTRRRRIVELSGDPDIHDLDVTELRELLKRILKKRVQKRVPDEFSYIDLESLSKEQLEKMINTLMMNP